MNLRNDGSRFPLPDDGPEVLGSPHWLEDSDGRIDSWLQRFALVAGSFPQLPKLGAYRFAATWWRRLPSRGDVAEAWSTIPDSDVARAAERLCVRHLGPRDESVMTNHSYRTFFFANALARLEGVELDPDVSFAAAMLHDVGLGCSTHGVCFTRLGTREARRLDAYHGFDEHQALLAAAAVSHHITPGLKKDEGGLHAFYLQQATVLDLTGARAVRLPRGFVREVFDRYPELDIKHEGGRRWRAEAALVCRGRAQLTQRWARLSWGVRASPLPPPPQGARRRATSGAVGQDGRHERPL